MNIDKSYLLMNTDQSYLLKNCSKNIQVSKRGSSPIFGSKQILHLALNMMSTLLFYKSYNYKTAQRWNICTKLRHLKCEYNVLCTVRIDRNYSME